MATDFRGARVHTGVPGLSGGTISTGTFSALDARVTVLEGQPVPPDTTTDLTDWSTTTPTEGQYAIYTSGKWTPTTRPAITVPTLLAATADGGGSVITTGAKGYCTFNFAATITGWAIVNTPSGSVQWDILKDGVSIVASAPPAVTSGTGNSSTTLTGWTTAVAASETLTFSVTSATTSTLSSLTLHMTRTI